MKIVVLLGGEPYEGKIPTDDAYVIGVDGGCDWAKGKLRFDETLGDFDSAKTIPDPPPTKIYPSQKDETDGEIALTRALELYRQFKADKIELYGGGGGREDHFLGNLHLLYRAARAGARCEMINNRAKLLVFTGELCLENVKGKTVSLLPFGGDAHIIESEGLFYPANGLTLSYGTCRGVSNLGVDENARIVCGEGHLLVAINEEAQ